MNRLNKLDVDHALCAVECGLEMERAKKTAADIEECVFERLGGYVGREKFH